MVNQVGAQGNEAKSGRGTLGAQRHRLSGMVEYFEKHPKQKILTLLGPGTLWMILFVGAPLVAVFIFSFWESGFGGFKANYNLDNYVAVLTDGTFWKVLWWTIQVVGMLLVGIILLSLPASYAIWRVVKSDWAKLVILIACIIPFWTSYLTRMITWLPMFGREGIVNGLLRTLHITDQPIDGLLYTPLSMMIALYFLYIVFMIGPIYFSMTRIDEDVMAASRVFGANSWRTFIHVVLPLSRPGIMAGSLFVVILGLADFVTERVVGGGQNPMIAGLIFREIDTFVWAKACAMAIVLVVVAVIAATALLRTFDITKV
jgi:putative spermidine/putrescine transport system permease protein